VIVTETEATQIENGFEKLNIPCEKVLLNRFSNTYVVTFTINDYKHVTECYLHAWGALKGAEIKEETNK
jgi:hypothetical protein